MADLSPAAQAVWNAFLNHSEWEVTTSEIQGIAAALRAATDQVVPEECEPDAEEWIGQSAWSQANYRTRFKLLSIATELENGGAQ